MDSERVNEIRAALDEFDKLGEKSFFEISDHDNIRARQISDDMPDWLRDLLAENERLQRLVDAGERLYEAVLAVSYPAPQFHRETQEALLPALAMYEVNTLPDVGE